MYSTCVYFKLGHLQCTLQPRSHKVFSSDWLCKGANWKSLYNPCCAVSRVVWSRTGIRSFCTLWSILRSEAYRFINKDPIELFAKIESYWNTGIRKMIVNHQKLMAIIILKMILIAYSLTVSLNVHVRYQLSCQQGDPNFSSESKVMIFLIKSNFQV